MEDLMNKALIDINSCQVNDVAVLKLFLAEVENGEKKRFWN
jgi:hypothetical protein